MRVPGGPSVVPSPYGQHFVGKELNGEYSLIHEGRDETRIRIIYRPVHPTGEPVYVPHENSCATAIQSVLGGCTLRAGVKLHLYRSRSDFQQGRPSVGHELVNFDDRYEQIIAFLEMGYISVHAGRLVDLKTGRQSAKRNQKFGDVKSDGFDVESVDK